jgi:non-homologous end joining protein Ku
MPSTVGTCPSPSPAGGDAGAAGDRHLRRHDDFASFRDDYQVGLREIIDAKIEGRENRRQEEEAPQKVVNLMEALRKSLDDQRGEEGARSRVAAGPGKDQGKTIAKTA